jgi:hypothetical protein
MKTKLFKLITLTILLTVSLSSCWRKPPEQKILVRVVVENPIVYIDQVLSNGRNTGIKAHIYYDGHIYKIEEITNHKIYSNQLIEGTSLNIPDKFVLVAYEQPRFILFDRPLDTIYTCKYNFSKFSKDIK